MIQTPLTLALLLMMLQGALGALDTLYYHEWKYKLCAHPEHSRVELQLHGARDLIYAALFLTLPRWTWSGAWVFVLVGLLFAEIAITLVDFVIERRVRRAWGGLASGELVMHAVMAIIYGAFLLSISPHLLEWSSMPHGFTPHTNSPSPWIKWSMTLMGIGVGLAGVRDLAVTWGVKVLEWPWRGGEAPTQVVAPHSE